MFLDNEDGTPIQTYLDREGAAVLNESFTKALGYVANTLVERTSEIISQNKVHSSLPVTVNGITIGAVNPNLEAAAAELQNQLQGRGLPVERITLSDLSSKHAGKIFKDSLSKSALFILPFDYGEVQLSYTVGGHLNIQEKIVESAKSELHIAFWLTPRELGGIEANEEDAEKGEENIAHLAKMSESAIKGGVNVVVSYILARIGPDVPSTDTKLPTIYIENDLKDERIMQMLASKLDELWKKNHQTEPHLVCLAVPWKELRTAKEDTLKGCHGIILIYGNKTFESLMAQIQTFEKRLDPLSHNEIKLGKAVACSPPNAPRRESVGYPLNFDCIPNDDHLAVEEDRVKDFLNSVLQSFQSF